MALPFRWRFRKPAGAGGSSATTVLWSLSFSDGEGYASDKFQRVNGSSANPDANPLWGDADLGSTGDGVGSANGQTVPPDWIGDRVITAANRSGSSGARGFRHLIVFDSTAVTSTGVGSGHNQVGGGIKIRFDGSTFSIRNSSGEPIGPFRELWWQWQQRYSSGLTCHNLGSSVVAAGNGNWSFVKDMDFNNDSDTSGRVIFGQSQGNGGVWGAQVTLSPGTPKVDSTVTWPQQNGGLNSGGNIWNKYEVYMKADTGTTNGLMKAWINDALVFDVSTINYSHGNSTWRGWTSVRPGVNASHVGNDSDINNSHTDYDDFKLSTSGQIG